MLKIKGGGEERDGVRTEGCQGDRTTVYFMLIFQENNLLLLCSGLLHLYAKEKGLINA